MHPGEKIRIARDATRPPYSQQKLADAAGVDKYKINNWEQKRSRPNERDLRLIASVLHLPVAWFWDEQDSPPPFMDSATAPASPGGTAPSFTPGRIVQAGVGRRFFPLSHTAGAASFPLDSGATEDAIEFSDDLTDRFRTQYAVQVWGDSGNPEIKHGDYLLITEDPSFRYPGFYVLAKRADGMSLVKILDIEDGRLAFKSRNPDYPPIPVDDGCEMVGFAVGWRRENGPGHYIEAGHKSGLRPGFLGM